MVSIPIPHPPQAATADRGAIDRRVIDVIQEVLGLEQPPSGETSLVEDLGIGSMDTMTLVLTLEDEFDAEMDEAAIESLRTVNDVLDLVRSQVTERPGGSGFDEGLE